MSEQRPDQQTEESIELVRRAQGGELEALDRLFERYYQRVHAIVRIRLGDELRRNLESGDVLHEALIEAIRSFHQFDARDEASLIHWLAKIVENCSRKCPFGKSIMMGSAAPSLR